jgi:DNA-binding transcriptional ArsR family regulator
MDGGSGTPIKIEYAAARLEALGNPTRLRVYRMLVKAGDAGLPVGKLQARLSIPASTLSHHLKTLVIVGLIAQEGDAKTLYCKANYAVMRGLVGFLVDECCTEADCVWIKQKNRRRRVSFTR